MKTEKAKVAKVPFGSFEIDGLMMPDGSFAIGVPQVTSLFGILKHNASRDIKALLGKEFRSLKVGTELGNELINVLTLPDFEKVTFELAMKGNAKAQEFVRSLYGLSLHQLFCDAFEVEIDAEGRQKWLKKRQKTKIDFHPLTNQLKAHGMKDDFEFGLFIHIMQEKIGLKDGTRDLVDFDKLQELEDIQLRLVSYMECGVRPYEALAKYVERRKSR